MRRGDKLAVQTFVDVGFENLVRVVEVRNDDVELGEIIAQVFRQFSVTRKKSGQCARLDRLHSIHQSASERELCDMRVAQDFKMRVGKLIPQRSENGKRENEISNRAAADDEDFSLLFSRHIARKAVRP